MSETTRTKTGKPMSENEKGRRKAMGSFQAKLAGMLAGACLLVALAAPGAQADLRLINVIQPVGASSTNWQYKGKFMPRGLAVDPSSHEVFVAGMAWFGQGEGRLHKFDANEVETVFGREIGQFPSVWGYMGLTIDPATKTVYGLNSDVHEVEVEVEPGVFEKRKMMRLEKYAYSTKKGTPAYFEVEGNGQVAMGPEGHFFVPSSPGYFGFYKQIIAGEGSVKEYSHSGQLLQTITCAGCPGPEHFMAPTSVALDAQGDLYVADAENNRVIKLQRSGASFVNPTVFVETEFPGSIAVNRSNGDVFIGSGKRWWFQDYGQLTNYAVSAYHSNGTKFTELGGPYYDTYGVAGGGDVVAVDSQSGEVYVGDLPTITEERPWGPEVQLQNTIIYVFGELPPPSAVTDPATVTASRHVTLNASVNPHGSTVEECRFLYGETEAYGEEAPCLPDPGFGVQPVETSAEISGLQPTTTYHYKVVVSNEAGTAEGEDEEFTTLIDTPAVATGGVSGLSHVGATLEGTVNPLGNPVEACRFEYGADASYGKQVPCSVAPGSGTSTVAESGAISGLEPATTYHYRIFAANAGGVSEGEDHSFTTLPHPPAVTTGAASQILADGAKIVGNVNPEGALTSFHFEYGTTSAYGQSSPEGTTPAAMSKPAWAFLTGLTPASTYHYRLVATNAGGTTTGADKTFTTGPRPIGHISIPATAPLQQGKARVALTCQGAAIAECKGTLILRGRIKQGIRFILVKIGSRDFDFFGTQTKPVVVALNGNGRKAVSQSEGKPLRTVASAAGANRELRLMPGGGKGRRGRR